MIRYKFIKENQWKDVHEKVQKLNADIASATEFVREIERGNLDVSIGTEISESELKTSLVSMRDQMKKYSLTDKQRNWVNEGLAKFVQILRSGNNDGRSQLADSIIRNLVSYLKANQGALFALNDDDPNDIFLEIEACYAYDRKKFLEKRIAPGEGLVGQVVLEKSTLYMTDVPKDFIKITSGLGDALPRNILLVPLKLDEKIFGVVELASFLTFEPYEIEFVEKLGESIAATVAAVKSGERTKALLKESQLQAEQLKAQEEEVRQNLEELSATQEAMQRAMSEVETKEAYITQILNTSQDLIYTVDREFRMVTWNSMFARELERINVKLEKGMNAFEWSPEDRKKLIELYKRVLNGENFELNYDTDLFGKKYYYLSVLAPIKSVSGDIIEAGVYARDVTAMVEAQLESTRLLKDAQQQGEQLKAQEEELRQNMEELSATQDLMERTMSDLEAKEAYTSELLNSTDDLIYSVDREMKLVTWNRAFAQAVEELNVRLEKGMDAFEWLGDYRKSLIPFWKRALNGETFQFQFEGDRKEGKDHFLAIYAPVRSKSGEILEAVVFAKNIAELVEAQRESARLLKDAQRAMSEVEAKELYGSQILNTAQDTIYTVDKEFRFATWNSTFARAAEQHNIRLEKGMNAFEWSPADRQNLVALYKRVFNGETFELTYEMDLSGKKYHFISLYAPLKSISGDVIEAAVYAKDISTVVEAQQESTRLLKDAQQQAEELKAQEEELRQNMEELSATQEEVVRKQEEANKLLQKFELVTKTTTEGLWDMEVPKDNNITDDTPVFWADRFRHMLGYNDEKDFPNALHSWSDQLHPDHKQKTLDAFGAHLYDLSGETPFDVEYQLKLKNGSYRWFRAIGNTMRDEKGNPLRVAGSLIDIQGIKDIQELQLGLESKVAERTKEVEAKALYGSQLLNTAQDTIYTVDQEFRFVTWNSMFALAAERINIRLEKGMNAFEWSAVDRQNLVVLYKRVFNGETFELTYEIDLDGKKYHFLSLFAPIKSASGDIIEAAVYAKDITALVEAQQESERLLKDAQQQAEELKAQEEELRQNMEELSATQEVMEQKALEVEVREEYVTQVLNTSQDIIFTVDQDFKLVTWNESFARSVDGLGVQPQKGMIAFEWRSDKERQHFAGLFTRVFKGESFETRVESKFDGTTHHFVSTFSPLRNKANEIIEAVVFARDITRILNEHGAQVGNEKSISKKSGRRKDSSKGDETPGQSVATKDSSNGKSHS